MFIESYNKISHRSAIVESSRLATWLYITATDTDEPMNDAFICCTEFLKSFKEAGELALAGEAPSITADLATAYSQRDDLQEDEIEIIWSADGEAAAVSINGEFVAFSVASQPKGYSKGLARVSDWGEPWDQAAFDALFG